MQPSDHTSASRPWALRDAISGDMKLGVPHMVKCFSSGMLSLVARPKSAIFTFISLVSNRLDRVRSRCRMPYECSGASRPRPGWAAAGSSGTAAFRRCDTAPVLNRRSFCLRKMCTAREWMGALVDSGF
ncbi:hypothetical protein BpHYR1_030761 [Brachionus plicatilis]|uniref:Uncharacterized protein n=1 Tax=Brachionus plicatilis TaxID=10195 RepID=A0A3M7PVL0_BRAPC|nr:hypothetical protein BpHYR1_030761 [Brachionus plicatilis]